DVPTHYGWKVDSKLERLQKAYDEAKRAKPKPSAATKVAPSTEVVEQIVKGLDAEGRWPSVGRTVEKLVGQPKFKDGESYLDSAVFARNLTLLAAYLEADGK
ncbi:MAG: pectate lyase, partial [Planctomycetia bacterium]